MTFARFELAQQRGLLDGAWTLDKVLAHLMRLLTDEPES